MLEIRNLTKSRINSKEKAQFESIFSYMMPKSYELSLVLCADKLSRRLNRESRSKDHVANVLSFPLDKSSGEIFLNIRKADREAGSFERKPKEHRLALFIHGLAHLLGHDHSSAMDKLEAKVRKHFGIN